MTKLLRTSERSAYKQDLYSWYVAYVLEREPVRSSTALSFGTLIHKALELADDPNNNTYSHPADAFEAVYDEQPMTGNIYDEDGDRFKALDLGVAMLEGYIERWEETDKQLYDVLAVEYKFRTPVKPGWDYVGTIDKIVRNRKTGGILLWDYKTASSIQTDYLELDDQTSAYWGPGATALEAAGIITEDHPLEGLVFDFLRKAMPDKRQVDGLGASLNKNGSVSKTQPKPLFARQPTYRSPYQRNQVMAQILAEIDAMETTHAKLEKFRKGEYSVDPIYPTSTKFTFHLNAFNDVALVDAQGGDALAYLDATTKHRDPYESYKENHEKED